MIQGIQGRSKADPRPAEALAKSGRWPTWLPLHPARWPATAARSSGRHMPCHGVSSRNVYRWQILQISKWNMKKKKFLCSAYKAYQSLVANLSQVLPLSKFKPLHVATNATIYPWGSWGFHCLTKGANGDKTGDAGNCFRCDLGDALRRWQATGSQSQSSTESLASEPLVFVPAARSPA